MKWLHRFALALILVGTSLQSCSMNRMAGESVNDFTKENVVPYVMTQDDILMACSMGQALAPTLLSFHRVMEDQPPYRTSLLTLQSAGMCAEMHAWELEVQANVALKQSRVVEAQDLRIAERRTHALAAKRYDKAFAQMEGAFPKLKCPENRDDGLYYLLGLTSGLLALIHDRAAEGVVGVPMELPIRLADASHCLDDQTWWYLPQALRAVVWATVPGSAPKNIDPWTLLQQAAEKGDQTGVRLAHALWIQATRAAGKNKALCLAINSFEKSSVDSDPKWTLLDQYAYAMARHEVDLLWIKETGHRMPNGEMICYWNEATGDLHVSEPFEDAEEDAIDQDLLDGL